MEANYNSLPNIVCDDFFSSYARSLFGDQADFRPQGACSGPKTSQVRVSCKLSELDGSHRLIRRRLTQVREESVEEEHEEEDEQGHELSSSRISMASGGPGDDNFRIFLENQASSGRSRIELQGSRARRKPGKALTRRESSAQKQEPKCYELFCVHQSSLLVHRSQALVEAERLSRRLDRLMCSGGG